MMRGLPMDFPNDKAGYSVDNQFMFGSSILVAPVTEEMYYQPQTTGDVIPAKNLFSPDGKPGGLLGHYYKGINFDKQVNVRTDTNVDFNWCGGPPAGCPISNYSVRWTGEILTNEAGEYEIGAVVDDGVRLWLDDEMIIDSWKHQGVSYYSKKVRLESKAKFKIKLEYFQGEVDALIKLVWKTPSSTASKNIIDREKSSDVYLPESNGWFDFWTGEKFIGGLTITKETPIDIMPLFIKAGSILPMGPLKQYATEKPEDPIELRIYTGADAEFLLYEDENDNYNYEQGVYAIIPFHWNEKEGTLTIGKRQGFFSDMLPERTFKIAWVGPDHGVGVETCENPDEEILYSGGDDVVISKNRI